jgi:hypothetical protein
VRRHHLDALFLIQVYLGSKFCPSVLEIAGLRVPSRHIRDFALCSVCSSSKNGPSARCASAANVVYRNVDIFGAKNVLLNHVLWMKHVCMYVSSLAAYWHNHCKYTSLTFLLVMITSIFYAIIIIIIISSSSSISLMKLPVSTLCCVCNWPCSCWLGTYVIKYWIELNYYWSRDRSVLTVTSLRAANRGIVVPLPAGARDYCCPQRPYLFWGPPSFLSSEYFWLFHQG